MIQVTTNKITSNIALVKSQKKNTSNLYEVAVVQVTFTNWFFIRTKE